MTTRQLAQILLSRPDVPVVTYGDKAGGLAFEVTEVSSLGALAFIGVYDSMKTPRNGGGIPRPRACVMLHHGVAPK